MRAWTRPNALLERCGACQQERERAEADAQGSLHAAAEPGDEAPSPAALQVLPQLQAGTPFLCCWPHSL